MHQAVGGGDKRPGKCPPPRALPVLQAPSKFPPGSPGEGALRAALGKEAPIQEGGSCSGRPSSPRGEPGGPLRHLTRLRERATRDVQDPDLPPASETELPAAGPETAFPAAETAFADGPLQESTELLGPPVGGETREAQSCSRRQGEAASPTEATIPKFSSMTSL